MLKTRKNTRKLAQLVAILIAPLVFTQCQTTDGQLASTGFGNSTPSHNFSKADYPFDRNGNYREEWVKWE